MPAYYNTSIPVSVYDFETRNHIGDYESINIACRKLYIRNATTVTSYLTITDEHYAILKNKYNLENDNDIATKAIRLCLERVRKQTGKSVKHWFITELGHEKTERLHLHG